MASYIIQGGNRLEGKVKASGSKNASLPIIAASILNCGIVELHNVPFIRDVFIMLNILEILGCKIQKFDDKIIIDSTEAWGYEIPKELMNKMRSSVMLAGAIIGRNRKAIFSYPGGCEIGSRPIDLHLNALRKLGINIKEDNNYIYCDSDLIKGEEIILEFPSVGATENVMLSSVFCDGITVIRNAAKEPEIEDLQNFLNSMGAKIEGAGTNIISITGVKKLHDVIYSIMPDRIEVGTFLCAGAATKGDIEVTHCNYEHIIPILNKLKEIGCNLDIKKDIIKIKANKRLNSVQKIETLPYPGFPTDMQSIFVSTLSTCNGNSLMVENIFENRYKYVGQLVKMGADITINQKEAIIKGVDCLKGARVEAKDLRGGAALVIAGLAAKGITQIENIEYIERGYESFDKKLNSLGANIKKCDD